MSGPGEGPAILAEGLTKRFGAFTAVDGVSFEVRPGRIFGLLGANGAGKSTAIRMLCGLLAPDGGRARVAGIDVARDPEGVKSRIGYMSQKFSLYGDLTPRENAEFFSSLYDADGGGGRGQGDPIARAFDRTGLSGGEGRPDGVLTRDLSAGYRQRLALACAILHRPRVLFLDEPTAGVDPVARRRFWDLIYGFAEEGAAVLVTTHYLDEAEYCSEVTLMRDGRIVAAGRPGDLKRACFPGPVLEIEAGRTGPALEALRREPWVEEAAVFGSRIHAALSPGYGLDRVASLLAASGAGDARIRETDPTLEDAFLKIVSSAGPGAAGPGSAGGGTA